MKISPHQILSRLQNPFLRYNKMVFRAKCRYAGAGILQKEHSARAKKHKKMNMLRYVFAIALSLAAAVASGIIFLFALIHQFALVEIAASLATALQVYFLSSAIADMIERAKRPNKRRNSLAILFAVFLVAFYSFTLYFR